MTPKLKTIAMIPARYEASRFPGKLMQDLEGKPVIIRTYEAAVKTQLFDTVYVVTDSDLIYNTVKAAGGEVIMSQKEHSCGSDRIAEAVADLDVDIVVNVQGDEPFTNEDDMRNVLQVFYENGAEAIDLASLMTPIAVKAEIENPNNVKVIVDEANFALYFSRAPIPFPRDQDIDITYYKHKGIYAFRKQAVLDFAKLPMRGLEAAEKIEAIRYLEYGKRIKMVYSDSPAIGIDTPQDLEEARLIIKKQQRS
ncbi:3-deoxy-manno-octulosonate cytidylyltransferase [Leeuwenhoekiella polynyae]|uniref:3-deoxy-manno-octulosonate cytidylyltransferase n=1 Tax=Leeuwenhoekiella polynyae TaxID=1550906 RepID=A0A4Q0P5D6_9FLAO|nr:3-deoxy-manno-octulosonate cytidylyltransferase [Leeuwenhoekiella polynyae]RXG21823.1 3-deoxy-manno-octulosonate cytidylyltransferase (CMP-KDO synthetase) [Leeuwenhoekiella polynyae]